MFVTVHLGLNPLDLCITIGLVLLFSAPLAEVEHAEPFAEPSLPMAAARGSQLGSRHPRRPRVGSDLRDRLQPMLDNDDGHVRTYRLLRQFHPNSKPDDVDQCSRLATQSNLTF